MITIIDNNNIYLTRGDSAVISLDITDEHGERYIIQETDKVYFTIKQHFTNEEIILKKSIEDNAFIFKKEDTIDMNFGSYDYDIRLENSSIIATVLTGIIMIGGGTNE